MQTRTIAHSVSGGLLVACVVFLAMLTLLLMYSTSKGAEPPRFEVRNLCDQPASRFVVENKVDVKPLPTVVIPPQQTQAPAVAQSPFVGTPVTTRPTTARDAAPHSTWFRAMPAWDNTTTLVPTRTATPRGGTNCTSGG